jgi:hypothetical protein
MQIIAIREVSLSELQTMDRLFTEEYVDNTDNAGTIKEILYGLGINTNQIYEKQYVRHRNRFGNIVTGTRWVGNERIDKEWTESGYASAQAKDKSRDSKLLNDLYRAKGEAVDSVAEVFEFIAQDVKLDQLDETTRRYIQKETHAG